MLNLTVMTGRMVETPELKTTANNVSVTVFRIAVSRNYKVNEEYPTDFFNVVAWRSTAEFAAKHFKKGDLLSVQGRFGTRKYTDKNGNQRTAFEVVANNVQFVESKRDTASAPETETAPAASYSNAGVNDFSDIGDMSDDDLPF